MINFLRDKLITEIASLLVFTIVFFTGCASASIETIDGKTLSNDCRDIKTILSFKLKSGETYADSNSFIYLECGDSSDTKLVYETLKKDNTYNKQSFNVSEILNVKVRYPKENTGILVTALGGVLFIGIMVLIFASSDKSGRP